MRAVDILLSAIQSTNDWIETDDKYTFTEAGRDQDSRDTLVIKILSGTNEGEDLKFNIYTTKKIFFTNEIPEPIRNKILNSISNHIEKNDYAPCSVTRPKYIEEHVSINASITYTDYSDIFNSDRLDDTEKELNLSIIILGMKRDMFITLRKLSNEIVSGLQEALNELNITKESSNSGR